MRNPGRCMAVLGILVAPTIAPAQQTVPTPVDQRSPLQGVVVDESTFDPIGSATVSIVGTDRRTTTDAFGSFAFSDPPTGPVTVRIAASGHVGVVHEVRVQPDRIAYLQVRLPPLNSLLSEVLASAPPVTGDATEPMTAADLVARRVPGLVSPGGRVGEVDRPIRLRGVTSFIGQGEPHLFVDGIRVVGTRAIYDVLTQIPATDVEGIEILRGPAAAFLHSYAADGVIHVYTRSGRRRSE